MEKVNEILSIIHGYKKSALLFNINKLPFKQKVEMLRKEFPQYVEELISLDKYINYQDFNYELWRDIQTCIIEKKPKIKTHADLNIRDYVIGLNQRNKLTWKNIDYNKYFDFVKDKVVLDFGCGGGFYSDVFAKLASKVYCLDRPEIIKVTQEEISLRKDKCKYITSLNEIEEPIQIAWISEVIHGKDTIDVHNMLVFINEILSDEGSLIINELRPDTPLGEMFDMQMQIHTKGGVLYRMEDMMSFFNHVSLIKQTNYHWTIGGKIL